VEVEVAYWRVRSRHKGNEFGVGFDLILPFELLLSGSYARILECVRSSRNMVTCEMF